MRTLKEVIGHNHYILEFDEELVGFLNWVEENKEITSEEIGEHMFMSTEHYPTQPWYSKEYCERTRNQINYSRRRLRELLEEYTKQLN